MDRCFLKHRPGRRALTGFAATAALAAAAHAGPTITNLVQSARLCPPSRVGDPQPEFDLYSKGDDQTKPKDAWFNPIGMFKADEPALGSGYRFFDETRRGLVLLGIGGATPGDGSDYFSPRIVELKDPLPDPPALQFHLPGVELGRCLYPVGRNKWHITFKDDNTNAIPDKFLTSKWETRGVPKGKVKEESVTYKADLDTKKLAAIKVDPKPGPQQWELTDLVLADVGADLSTLALFGVPTPVKEPADPGTASQSAMLDEDPLWGLSVSTDVLSAAIGDAVLYTGELSNYTDTSLSVGLSFRGANLRIDAGPDSLTLLPGESMMFEVTGTILAAGPAGLAVLAQPFTGGDFFTADAAVAIPAPATLFVLIAGAPALGRKRARPGGA